MLYFPPFLFFLLPFARSKFHFQPLLCLCSLSFLLLFRFPPSVSLPMLLLLLLLVSDREARRSCELCLEPTRPFFFLGVLCRLTYWLGSSSRLSWWVMDDDEAWVGLESIEGGLWEWQLYSKVWVFYFLRGWVGWLVLVWWAELLRGTRLEVGWAGNGRRAGICKLDV